MTLRSGLFALAAAALPAAAQPVYVQTSADYSFSAIASGFYTDADGSTELGNQTFSLFDQGSGYGVSANGAVSFTPGNNRMSIACNAFSITRPGSTVDVSTSSTQTIGFDLLVDSRVTMRSFNIGWRALVSNNGVASLSSILTGPDGIVINRQAPDFTEFFTETANLPAGSYTWSVFGTTGSDDAPGFPSSTQHSASINSVLELAFTAGFGPCNAADQALPYNTLDVDDVLTFLNAFATGSPTADVAAPFGTLDIDDVLVFLNAFAAGCP